MPNRLYRHAGPQRIVWATGPKHGWVPQRERESKLLAPAPRHVGSKACEEPLAGNVAIHACYEAFCQSLCLLVLEVSVRRRGQGDDSTLGDGESAGAVEAAEAGVERCLVAGEEAIHLVVYVWAELV